MALVKPWNSPAFRSALRELWEPQGTMVLRGIQDPSTFSPCPSRSAET